MFWKGEKRSGINAGPEQNWDGDRLYMYVNVWGSELSLCMKGSFNYDNFLALQSSNDKRTRGVHALPFFSLSFFASFSHPFSFIRLGLGICLGIFPPF